MKTFIDNVIDFTKDWESPTSFWKWASYAIVGAALRDAVWWRVAGTKICPNMFVLLNAPSGKHRKSGPINLAGDLLRKIQTPSKLIEGRSSIQGIMKELSSSYNDRDTGIRKKGGSGIILSGELSSSLVNAEELVPILTDFYDYKEKFTKRLSGEENTVISNLCVSLLGGSNDDLLQIVYTAKAVKGGLLGRTFLIKPDEYRPGWSGLQVDSEDIEMQDKMHEEKKGELVKQLDEIAKLSGKIAFTYAAKAEFDKWYKGVHDSLEKKEDGIGIMSRIHISALKVSVVLCLCNTHELVVQKEHILQGIDECMKLVRNYEMYTMSIGESDKAAATAKFLTALWAFGGEANRRQILGKHWADFTAAVLDEIVKTLSEAGLIEQDFRDGESYVMTHRCREIFSKGGIGGKT